jgi:hypothetical protein
MSYSKFLDDVNAYMVWCDKNNIKHKDTDRYFDHVRDKWIEEGRIKELISFILENWDSGNCDDFIPPLETYLVTHKETSLFKRLWKGIIRYRLEKLWDYADKEYDLKRLDKIDVSKFNMFRTESYNDPERVVAFQRKFSLAAIDKYMKGLEELGENEEVERILSIRNNVVILQRPKPKPTTDKRKIDDRLFWDLIQESRSASQDQFESLEKLKDKLESFHPTEIRKFQKILLTKFEELNSWDLWALAYIVRRGCGDDGFDYFKAWVISKGESAFQSILTLNLKKIAPLFDEDPQLEDLLYLAEEVYENKTGDIMKPVSVRNQKMKGLEWSEENLETRYPELSKLFEYSINRG